MITLIMCVIQMYTTLFTYSNIYADLHTNFMTSI